MEAQRTSVSNAIYLAHFNSTEVVSKWWRNVLDRDMVKQVPDSSGITSLISFCVIQPHYFNKLEHFYGWIEHRGA